MTNSNRIFLKHSACDNAKRTHACPFAAHDRWTHWAQNTSERHQVNGQNNVYLRKNPEDDNLTEDYLRKILRPGSEGNEEFQKLFSHMQICNSNIVGSNAYFHRKIMELESLIECKGMHTS